MNRRESLPRILILARWAPPAIGGPKNLYNLISQFPRDSYVVLTSAGAIDPRSAATGVWLPGKYVFFDRKEGGPVPREVSPAGDADRLPLRGRASSWVERYLPFGKAVLDALYLLLYLPKVVLSARKVIRKDRITCLLGISDEGVALLGTYLAHKLSGLPYALFLFDLYLGNNLTFFTHAVARVLEPRLIRAARAVIVTNEATGEYLRQRYGDTVRPEIVRNSAFPEEYEGLQASGSMEPPYRILFTGHIYWAQEGAVLNMIQAMDLLRDLPVELVLYCPRVTKSVRIAVAGRQNVRLTSAPQAEMPRIQSEASLLFLPLAWGTDAPDIIATASPGKFTDYLASGRPMLVHAPEYSYVSRYAREHGVGIVVDRDDVETLAGEIRNFFQEPERGRRCVERALKVFRTQHDARENAKKLWRLFGDGR